MRTENLRYTMDKKDRTKGRKESMNKKIPVGAQFTAPLQTGLRDQPASHKMGTDSLSRGYNARGVALTTHHHLALSSKKE